MTYAHKPGTEHLVVIPLAPWYVLAHDVELNVDARVAFDASTRIVVPARSVAQAKAIERILGERVGTTDVFVTDRYPEHVRGLLYVLVDADNADWFQAGRV